MPHLSVPIDQVTTRFSHDQAVANAGMIATSTLAGRLGIEKLTDEAVSVGFRPGRKLLTLVDALVAGGDCIDDVDVLRTGATARILGHDVVCVDDRDVASRHDVWACPPARPCHRDRAGPGVGGRSRARRRRLDDRHRFDDL